MALAERTVEVATEGDVTVGKITDTIVDEKTGVVAQKETIAMEVPDGRGGTNIVVAQRLRAVQMPNWIQQSITPSSSVQAPQQLQLTAPPATNNTTTTANTNAGGTNNSGSSLCDLVCLPFFLPCVANNFCLFFWIFVVVSGVGSLIPLTVVWPLKNCDDLQLTSRILLALLSLVACIMFGCFCYGCCFKNDSNKIVVNIIYICTGTCVLLFIAFAIAASVILFGFGRYNGSTCDGRDVIVIIAAVSFSYLLIVLFTFIWCFCCYQCWKTIRNNN